MTKRCKKERKFQWRHTKQQTHFRIGAYGRLAFLAGVCEQVLVAFDAVRVFLAQNVAVTSEREVAVETTEVTTVPVLLHRFRVFARKNKLKNNNKKCAISFRNYYTIRILINKMSTGWKKNHKSIRFLSTRSSDSYFLRLYLFQ